MKRSLSKEIHPTPFLRCFRTVGVVLCLVLFGRNLMGASAGSRQIIHNVVPAAVASAPVVHPALRLQKINLALTLPLRNKETLSNLLAQIYDPGSPNFHHYLTSAQFTEQFGPTEADYEAVIAFAQAHGLTVTTRNANRTVVGVRGTVLDIEKAMHVSLNEYKHPTENRTFRAPDREPSLDLAVPLLFIHGLDNYSIPKPLYKSKRLGTVSPDGQVTLESASTPVGTKSSGGSATPDLTGSGPSGYYLPKDFRAAYLPGTTLTGAGQSVGLFELDSGYYPVDITTFESADGLGNIPVIPVLIDGYSGVPVTSGQDPDTEVSLDIEVAMGMAPGLSSVYCYEGTDPDDVLASMAAQDTCATLSCSWGWNYPADPSPDQSFIEMAAQGQSFFCASGDGGAYTAEPDTPDDNPHITMVGGTVLSTTGPAGAWAGETAWVSGGGGISQNVAIPTYQQGISITANHGSTTFRTVPDVSGCAENIIVYSDNGQVLSVGGTSSSTPMWAGMIANANQLATAYGQPLVGFLNPAIYNLGKGLTVNHYTSLMHDITSGNNGSATQFPAVTGYDLATGWGSPAGTNFLNYLGLSEPLVATPFTAVIFNGPAGGPFTPSSVTYTLTNNGPVSLNWSLSSPPAWLDVSPTSGTLNPGDPVTTVTISIDPSATNLVLGSYTYSMVLTDLTDSFAQTQTVTLGVDNPPLISLEPTNEALLVGMNATFTVGIVPNGITYYQWQENGTNLVNGSTISGVTTPTLSLTNVTPASAGTYSVIVSNALGAIDSSNAVLTIVSSQPVVVTAPTNTTVLPGDSAFFTVSVVGDTPYTYRWYLNGAILAQTSKYGKSTNSPALVITNCVGTNAGNYFVTISNSVGVTTSSVAMLNLIPVTAPNVTLYQNGAFGAPFTLGRTTSAGPQNPYSAVTFYGGSYYGTSFNGGAATGGTVYSVTPAGAFTTKVSFNGTNDGYGPVGSLVQANNGDFYGTCAFFGLYYDGALVQISGSGYTTATTLTQFGGDNGSEPVSALMQAADGNLYGCANAGGLYNYGTVFRQVISPASLTNLMSFNGYNGAYPSPVLIQATDGNLYGTAESGGDANGDGTIFKISTNGTFTLMATFNGANGSTPIAGLIQASDGNFYGTTLNGGANGDGTVFQMLPDGTINSLYSFTGGADGSQPWAGLVQGTNGNLYGTTQAGGTYTNGTVFQISLTGSFTTIAELDGLQGSVPEANLVQGPDGNLYGTCFSGGYLGYGSFFSISNSGPLVISGQPVDLTVNQGSSASFSVATTGNNATYYQWQENGTNLVNGGQFSGVNTYALGISNSLVSNVGFFSVIVSNVYNSVTSSVAELNVTVSLPSITSEPVGETNVVGSLAMFSVTAVGDQPLTYHWQANGINLTDGGNVFGSATPLLTISNLTLAANGNVYTVVVGNPLAAVTSSPAVLTVEAVTPLSAVTVSNTYFFNNGTNGASPAAALIQGKDGFLYGTASAGGTNLQGNVFRSTLNGSVTNLYSFPYFIANGYAPNGASPLGGLVQSLIGTNIYGTCQAGGPNNPGYAGYGTLFRLTNFTSITALYDFTGGTDGANPDSSLVQAKDGNFYGTAYSDGADSDGTIFRIATNGTFKLVYTFTGGSDGANPQAGLIQGSDGNLYGTTTASGGGYGTAFKITTNGLLTVLGTFNGANGAIPVGGLIQGKDGNFYGASSEGGDNGYGTVFQLSTNTGIKTLYSFAGTDGAFPYAGVIQGKDGRLYGTTAAGGPGNQGSVFLITTNGSLKTLLWFDGFNGADPEAALVQANDGNLYGTTSQGGPGFNPSTAEGGWGSIFRVVLPVFFTNTLTGSAVASLPFSGSLVPQTVVPLGDPLTYSLVSGPSWLSLTTNGLISGTPVNANIGTDSFVVSVTDTNGFTSSTNLHIVVVADPAPTFLTNKITGPWAIAGTSYSSSIGADATAPYLTNGDSITFALVSGPAWLNVSPSGTLSGTPLAANAGTNTFVISATDLGGSSNTATLSIFVDTAPIFSAPTLTYSAATAGLPYAGTLATNVTESAGLSLTYSELSGPPWLAVAADGALSGTPAAMNAGTNLFSVEVMDSYGLSATAAMEITVIPAAPPTFLLNPFTRPAATAGVLYTNSIAANAVETNLLDTLAFAKVSGPGWLSIAANGTVSGTPYSANGGTNAFVVSVTDLTGLTATATLYIDVTAVPITATITPQLGSFLLSWTGGLPPYQVLTSTNLSFPWQTLGTPTNATSLFLTNSGSGTFYEIQGN